MAFEQIAFLLQQTGAEAPLPERTAAPISAVEILHVALSQLLHQRAGGIRCGSAEQQMHVIRHQAVGVDGAPGIVCRARQPVEIKQVIRLGIEAHRTVVAALDNMEGNFWKNQASAARHAVISRLGSLVHSIQKQSWSVPYYY